MSWVMIRQCGELLSVSWVIGELLSGKGLLQTGKDIERPDIFNESEVWRLK